MVDKPNNDRSSGDGGDFKADSRQNMSEICERFSLAWHNALRTIPLSGDESTLHFEPSPRPDLRAFVEEVSEASRSALFKELLSLELTLRSELAGELPDETQYHRRFPEHSESIASLFREVNEVESTIFLDQQPTDVKRDQPIEIDGYEIIDELGRGGMGVVYKARDLRLKRLVALKMVLAGQHAGSEQLARFRAEAEVAARLQHPNIVQIFDIGQQEDHPYLTFELIEGSDLAVYTGREPQSPQFSAELVEAISRAIDYAHRKGIVHRDLKPANILLDGAARNADDTSPNANDSEATQHATKTGHSSLSERGPLSGQSDSGSRGRSSSAGQSSRGSGRHVISTGMLPKISDFGLAKVLDGDVDYTTTGAVLGTAQYMSPEQAQGRIREVGPASDVYSLGAILYFLLTGQPPFQGTTPIETLQMVVKNEPVPPTYLQPKLPTDLETVCLKCLEKDPARRYETAGALAEDLLRFLHGEPVRARPVGTLERMWRWCHRNPVIGASLASVLIVFLAAFLLVSWSYLRANDAFRKQQELTRIAQSALLQAEEREKAERWGRYRSNLHAAATAVHFHNQNMARSVLGDAPSEFRNFEWRHFSNKLDTSETVMRLPYRVTAAKLADGGKRVAMYRGEDYALVVWDFVEARELVALKATRSASFVISPDGKLIAFPTGSDSVMVWEIDTNRERAVFQGESMGTRALSFGPDSKLLATSSVENVIVWDTTTKKQYRVLPRYDTVYDFAFSPDGRWLLSLGGSAKTARVADLKTGKTKVVLEHNEAVEWGRFSPDSSRVYTVEKFPRNTIRIWNAETGEPTGQCSGHTNEIKDLAFNHDGSLIATASADQSARIWNGTTGEQIAVLQGHAALVSAAAFSPDGRRLLTTSWDRSARIWSVPDGQQVGVLHGHANELRLGIFSQDGTSIRTLSDEGIRRWNAQLAEYDGVLRGHTSFVYGLDIHPDGERVASSAWDGTIRIWNATTSKQLAMFEFPEKVVVGSICFHPDGKLLASLARDNSVRIWDVESGKAVKKLDVESEFWDDSQIHFNTEGSLLAYGDCTGQVYIWDVATWKQKLCFQASDQQARQILFLPDGQHLATSDRGPRKVVRIWNVDTGKLVHAIGMNDSISVMVLSQDAKHLAVVTGGVVHLLKIADWTKMGTLEHGVKVMHAAFTPDGTRLATACFNNTIRIWDLQTHSLVTEFLGHDDYVYRLEFSPDGTRLASASGDGTVRIWDSLSKHERAKLSASQSN